MCGVLQGPPGGDGDPRRLVALPAAGQHQAVPHLQEGHPGTHGPVNHQEEAAGLQVG